MVDIPEDIHRLLINILFDAKILPADMRYGKISFDMADRNLVMCEVVKKDKISILNPRRGNHGSDN